MGPIDRWVRIRELPPVAVGESPAQLNSIVESWMGIYNKVVRLTPKLAGLLLCISFGCLGEAFAADSVPKANPLDQALSLMETLNATKLSTPKPFGDTEKDYFEAMVSGEVPVDAAFCERIKLIEVTDGLLPALNQPLTGWSQSERTPTTGGDLPACRLFALRGQLLCKQGKIAEGQAWLLKPRLMARRQGGDQTLIQHLIAIVMETIGLETAARYIETWSESDRLAYIKSAEALRPMGSFHTAVRLAKDSLPKKDSVRTLLLEFKSLDPAQQQDRLNSIFGMGTHSPASGEPDDKLFRARMTALISSLTVESWDLLHDRISAEFEPLNLEKTRAFAARNADALKFVEAEEVKPTAPSVQKAEALYRVLMGPGIVGVARHRWDLELKAKLLIIAMQKGWTFDQTCLTNLTDSNGTPLKLGDDDGDTAIIAPGQRNKTFLIIGPRR